MMNEFRLIPGSVVELAMPAAQLQMVTSYIRNTPSPWRCPLCSKNLMKSQVVFFPRWRVSWALPESQAEFLCTIHLCAVFQFWLNENLYKQLLCSLQLNLNWNPDHCLSSVKPSIGIYAGSAEPLLFFKIIGTNYVKRILGCSDECDVLKKVHTCAKVF